MSIIYFEPADIFIVKDINTGETARDENGDNISYSYSKGLIGERGWRDISDVEMLIPTGLYDENEEMIYVTSFKELHNLVIKNDREMMKND